MELRPGHDTGHGQQDACSSAVGALKPPTTCVTKLPVGHRLHPEPETPGAGILSSPSAKGTGTAGCSMACGTQPINPLLLALRNAHAIVGRTGAARLPAPSADQRNSWSRHYSSERASLGSLATQARTTPVCCWTWHAIIFCSPHCRCSKQPEAHGQLLFPLSRAYSGPKDGRRARAAPLSAVANHSTCRTARWLKRRPRSQRQKPGSEMRRMEKLRQRTTIRKAYTRVPGNGQNPDELLQHGPALERDLERLRRKL